MNDEIITFRPFFPFIVRDGKPVRVYAVVASSWRSTPNVLALLAVMINDGYDRWFHVSEARVLVVHEDAIVSRTKCSRSIITQYPPL